MTLHHYRGAILKNVWIENGYERRETKWGAATSYTDVEGLSEAIAFELCLSNHEIDGDGVRFLRKRLDLTQDELGAELHCTGQAVAKWEKGENGVPAAAARLLRLFVLRKMAPHLPLAKALGEYNEPVPDRLVFSYAEDQGWACAAHAHAQISTPVHHTDQIPFAEALRKRFGFAGVFSHEGLTAFARNDSKYERHESKLIAA